MRLDSSLIFCLVVGDLLARSERNYRIELIYARSSLQMIDSLIYSWGTISKKFKKLLERAISNGSV